MVDASVVVSAATNPAGTARRALDRVVTHHRVALSDAVLAEVVAVLHRPKFARRISASTRAFILDALAVGALHVAPTLRVAACRDPKDDKYLELALAASADAIVTGDADLLALHPFRDIPILSPAAFLAAFEA